MENVHRQDIRSAKKTKAAGPERVPTELLQVFPASFSELLYELFAEEARLRFVMKYWDFSILTLIYKNKFKLAVPTNHLPLRLFVIPRKMFEMGTTVRLLMGIPMN